MALLNDHVLEQAQCIYELAAACQRFVGGVTIVEPGALAAAIARLAADLPNGHTDEESVLIWNAVSSTAVRGVSAHHQLFHRFFGGACLFSPLWLPVPESFGSAGVRDALVRWAQQSAESFERVHDWPVALKAAALLQQHPQAEWYVGELARSAGASRATLERSFRKFYGTTPQKYHALLRVVRTAEALRNESGSAEGVVISAGWASIDAFARTLRQLTGLPVTAIRQHTEDQFAATLRAALAIPIPQRRHSTAA